MALNFNTQYPTKSKAPDSDYPYGSAQNITTAGDGTGSPWEKQVLNDLLGMQQELLDLAGKVPSGSADVVGTSQYVDSIRAISGHPGVCVPLFLNAAPSTFDLRILLLDGTTVLASNYVDLVDATYVGNGANSAAHAAGAGFVKTSDSGGATPDTAGPYFLLPDMRGQFLRGKDSAGAIDPDGATRYLGDIQADAIQRHNHQLTTYDESYGYVGVDQFSSAAGLFMMTQGALATGTIHASAVEIGEDIGSSGIPHIGRVDVETRATNSNADWGIWY